jgi:hypothetical protein
MAAANCGASFSNVDEGFGKRSPGSSHCSFAILPRIFQIRRNGGLP